MSGSTVETRTFPADGIAHLMLEQVARDARLQGGAGSTVIKIMYHPAHTGAADEFVVEGAALRFTGAPPLRVTVPREMAVTAGEALGELRVQDVDGPVSLDHVRGDLRLKSLGGHVQVGQVDGSLRAEDVVHLRIYEGCAGDLRMQNGGFLSAEKVSGDVRLYQAGAVHLAHVHGDLWAEQLAGTLQVEGIDGDVKLAEIDEKVTLLNVVGDVRAGGLDGGLAASGLAGDADLRGPYGPEHEYQLSTAADLVAYVPIGADIRLTVRAGGRIRSDIQLTPAPDGSATFAASLGRGLARLALSAGGDVRIVQAERPGAAPSESGPNATARPGGAPDLGDSKDGQELGERIQHQVSAALAAAGIELEGPVRLDRSSPLMSPLQGRGPAGGTTKDAAAPEPRSPRTASTGPSQAEVLAVLKMVEAGAISAAEAEILLKALDGG